MSSRLLCNYSLLLFRKERRAQNAAPAPRLTKTLDFCRTNEQANKAYRWLRYNGERKGPGGRSRHSRRQHRADNSGWPHRTTPHQYCQHQAAAAPNGGRTRDFVCHRQHTARDMLPFCSGSTCRKRCSRVVLDLGVDGPGLHRWRPHCGRPYGQQVRILMLRILMLHAIA